MVPDLGSTLTLRSAPVSQAPIAHAVDGTERRHLYRVCRRHVPCHLLERTRRQQRPRVYHRDRHDRSAPRPCRGPTSCDKLSVAHLRVAGAVAAYGPSRPLTAPHGQPRSTDLRLTPGRLRLRVRRRVAQRLRLAGSHGPRSSLVNSPQDGKRAGASLT